MAPEKPSLGRGGRAARMLALAHHIERLIDEGKVADYAAVAHQLGLTRARLTQVMNLLLLAPEIQERLLTGALIATERALRRVVRQLEWTRQVDALAEPGQHSSAPRPPVGSRVWIKSTGEERVQVRGTPSARDDSGSRMSLLAEALG